MTLTQTPAFQHLTQQKQMQQGTQGAEADFEAGFTGEEGEVTEDLGADLGEPEEGSEGSEPQPWLRDLTEDDAYSILQRARHLDEKLESATGPLSSELAAIKKQLEGFQSTPSEPSVDVDKIKSVLEKYDPGLASAGLAEALAEAIRFTPLTKESFEPHLAEFRSQLGEMPIGNQIVLAHYDPDDIAAIIPSSDANGNPIPETQRHKEFLAWFDVQSPKTQQALQTFGAPYVRALKKFESWEQEQAAKRKQAVDDKSSRLAGGAQPSAKKKSGGATKLTADDLFLQGFNEA